MSDCIMVGCDLHNKTLVLRYAVGTGPIGARTFSNDRSGRECMIEWLRQLRPSGEQNRILFVYEASSQGFGLYDQLQQAGIEGYVLAPTRIARSTKHARGKNDGRDAIQLLELLRGHVLAGNSLPAIWIPDSQTRDDRELVRMRLDLAERCGTIKNQIQSLLKRNEICRAAGLGTSWSVPYVNWLHALAEGEATGLGPGGQAALGSLLRQKSAMEQEIELLDQKIRTLSTAPRYAEPAQRLRKVKGVGILSAMVFLTELGNLNRFRNRRGVASYVGLVPSSNESGERNDCKGHITRQGSRRIRKILCQSTWSRIRTDQGTRTAYAKLVEKNPKKKKIAVVAMMRRLVILMWHRALTDAPTATDPVEVAA